MLYLNLFIGMLTAPTVTLRELVCQPRPGAALLVYVLTNVVGILAGAYAAPAAPAVPLAVAAGLGTVLGLPAVLLYTAAVHLAAEFLGGRGRALALFTGMSFAFAPSVLLAPFGLAVRMAPPAFYYLVAAALGLWVFVLQVFALQATYRFSALRAIAALVLPVLTVLAAVFLSFVLGMAALLPELTGLLTPTL